MLDAMNLDGNQLINKILECASTVGHKCVHQYLIKGNIPMILCGGFLCHLRCHCDDII